MKIKNKQLVILAGANGTGKTTLSKEFLKEYNVDFINVDIIAEDFGKDISKFRIQAGKKFFKVFDQYVKKGLSFAIESTLSGIFLKKTINKLKKKGYKISIIYFFVDNPQCAINRIRIRVEKGGHIVPDKDVIRRFYRSKNNFFNVYRKLADEWSIHYNGNEKLIGVATGCKNKEEIMDDDLYKLFIKDIEK